MLKVSREMFPYVRFQEVTELEIVLKCRSKVFQVWVYLLVRLPCFMSFCSVLYVQAF